MGFCPVPNAFCSSALGSTTVTLPGAIKDGDLVLLFITTNNGVGITPPTGYTIIGSLTSFNAGSAGLYSHTWHTGDPTSGITFTTTAGSGNTSWVCCIVRSTNTPSVVSDQINTTAASTTKAVKSFPPTVVGDLRLLFYEMGSNIGGDSLTAPAVTPSANNPSGVKFQESIKLLNGGLSSGIWFSLNEDPSGADVSTVNWTSGQSDTGYLRSVVLSDGSGTYTAADETVLYEIQPDVVAKSMDVVAPDNDSTNARWWGGGTNTLGDHD